MLTVTSAQSMLPSSVVPSSGSVTVISYGTTSPKPASCPFSGSSIVTSGRELPTVIGTLSTPVAPDSSVTRSVAV